MALLKKNKKEKNEPEVKQEQAPQEEKVEKTDERFSGRAASTFAKMYRMILSVNIQANVCQIESGERNLCGDVLPVRMYYNAFIEYVAKHMHPDDKSRFARDFNPVNLSKALSKDECGCCGVYMLEDKPLEIDNAPVDVDADPLADPNAAGTATDNTSGRECSFYEFRADLIPDDGPVKTRCIIFIRKVLEKPVCNYVDDAEFEPSEHDDIDWSGVRVNCFLGGSNSALCEYLVADDIMYIHGVNDQNKSNIIKGYLKNIDARSDWSVYHGDMNILKDAIDRAMKGEFVSANLRYRPLDNKSLGFRYHRLSLSPADKAVPPKWLVGVMTDIDDEHKQEQASNEITGHVDKLLSELFTDIFEIDIDRDLIYKIRKGEHGYERESSPKQLSAVINRGIADGTIHPQSAREYEKWLEKGFLDRETLGKAYEFESRLKLKTSSDYMWYSESISRLEGGRRFIRFRRDINDAYQMRMRSNTYDDQNRFVEYSKKMLDVFASICESRDLSLSKHTTNVRNLTRILLDDFLDKNPGCGLSEYEIELYAEAATTHDIGMVIAPDAIARKNEKLSPADYEAVKQHTVAGAKMLDSIVLPGQEDLIEISKDVALHHHERYDGSGYPDRLVGDANKIGTQAVGIADVFDRLASADGARPTEVLVGMLEGRYGSFNPLLLQSVKNCRMEMLKLYSSEEIQ